MKHSLVHQTSPLGVQLFSSANTFFCFIELFDVSFNWFRNGKKYDFAPEGY